MTISSNNFARLFFSRIEAEREIRKRLDEVKMLEGAKAAINRIQSVHLVIDDYIATNRVGGIKEYVSCKMRIKFKDIGHAEVHRCTRMATEIYRYYQYGIPLTVYTQTSLLDTYERADRDHKLKLIREQLLLESKKADALRMKYEENEKKKQYLWEPKEKKPNQWREGFKGSKGYFNTIRKWVK